MDKNNWKELQQKIKALRKEKKIKVSEIAKKLDLTEQGYYYYENTDSVPSVENINKILKALGTDLYEISKTDSDDTSDIIKLLISLTEKEKIKWRFLNKEGLEYTNQENMVKNFQNGNYKSLEKLKNYKKGYIGESDLDYDYFLLSPKNEETEFLKKRLHLISTQNDFEIIADAENYYFDLSNLESVINSSVHQKDSIKKQKDDLKKLLEGND